MNQNNSGFLSSIPPVTLNIIIINLLILLANALLPEKVMYIDGGIGVNATVIDRYLALFSINTGNFMPHQLITYMFMHGGFGHLFFNMFAIFMFGRTLETIWGPKKFLLYYMLTGIGAGLTQLLVSYLTGAPSLTVGASGAVFGVLIAFGMLFPNSELFIIPFPFPIKAKWFVIGYGALELYLGISGNVNDNVAHFAHLGGLIVGFVIVYYWKKKGKTYDQRY